MTPNDARTADNSGISISLGEGSVTSTLFGIHDENLRLVEDAFGVRISARGSELHLRGDDPNSRAAGKVLTEMQSLIERGYPVTKTEMITAVRVVSEDPTASLLEFFLDDRAAAIDLAGRDVLEAVTNQVLGELRPALHGQVLGDVHEAECLIVFVVVGIGVSAGPGGSAAPRRR